MIQKLTKLDIDNYINKLSNFDQQIAMIQSELQNNCPGRHRVVDQLDKINEILNYIEDDLYQYCLDCEIDVND